MSHIRKAASLGGILVGLASASAHAQLLNTASAISAQGFGIDPTATWTQAPSITCPTLGGYSVAAGSCLKYNAAEAAAYLGWFTSQSTPGVVAATEMLPGAGQTDDLYGHMTTNANSGSAFGSEIDLNNITNSNATNFWGVQVVGFGVVSNAALKIGAATSNWGFWNTAILGTGATVGPTVADRSSSATAFEFQSGAHRHMINAEAYAIFTKGAIEAQSDPAYGDEDVLWAQTQANSNTGNWWVGPQRSDATRCGFCVTTPAGTGSATGSAAVLPTVTVGTYGDLHVNGSVAIGFTRTSRHLVSFGSGSGTTLTLAAEQGDGLDLANPGSATLSGTVTCADATLQNRATWSVTDMWDISSGTQLGTKVSLIAYADAAGVTYGATMATLSYGPASPGALPTLQVTPAAGVPAISCKAEQEFITTRV